MDGGNKNVKEKANSFEDSWCSDGSPPDRNDDDVGEEARTGSMAKLVGEGRRVRYARIPSPRIKDPQGKKNLQGQRLMRKDIRKTGGVRALGYPDRSVRITVLWMWEGATALAGVLHWNAN